jgi:hypothetical protein
VAELRAQPIEREVKLREVGGPRHGYGFFLPVYMASISCR